MAQDILRVYGNFAAAIGSVNYVLGYGIAGRVAAEILHDFEAFANAGAQVSGARNEVALVEVIRFDAAHQQLLNLGLHHGDVVIDIAQQHRLVAEWNACIDQSTECIAHFGGQFARMIGVNTDKKRMIFLQHRAKFRRDALGQENGNACADAQEFQMRNGAKLAEQMLQSLIAEQQWIAAAQQNITNFGMVADVFDLLVELRMKIVTRGVAHKPRASAVTAVGSAPIGDQKQNAIGIAMNQAWHWRVGIFTARIRHFPRRGIGLFDARDDLPSDGTILIGWINQVEKIRRDGQSQLVVGQRGTRKFLGCERGHQALQLFDARNSMLKLPAPIIPFGIGNITPKPTARCAELF